MKRRAAVILAISCASGAALLHAQGRGGAEWTTSGYDAQRTAWVKTDPRISPASMVKPGAFGSFKFLWKLKLEYDPKAATTLTPPVILDRLIGFRGFKSIVFLGTQSQTIHAIDLDYGEPLWKYHVNYTASPPPLTVGTADCPAGLSAAPSRPTAIAPSALLGRGGGGGRGGRSGGGVGEPGKGSITLATAGQARGGGPPNAAPPAGAGGAVPGSAAAVAGNQPGGLPAGARQGGPGGGRGGPFQPGEDAAYVVGSDGYLHALNVQNGWDNMTPALFLPANTHATGLIVATSDDAAPVAYAATTHGCGSQPDALWAMDLGNAQKPVTAFKVDTATIAGAEGSAIGRDGTVYIATTAGKDPLSSSVFALEPKTLTRRASAKVAGVNFNSSPVVFTWKDKDAVVVAGGGKLLVFDPASLGSGPVATSASFGTPEFETGALSTWTDASGTRWFAAPSPHGIVTFKLVDEGGKPAFQAGWTSREIASPLPPLVVNGVLFAASTGSKTVPATLYALDAASGKELWNSGRAITSSVRGGLAAGQGNVYVPGSDSTLYAFGFDIEK